MILHFAGLAEIGPDFGCKNSFRTFFCVFLKYCFKIPGSIFLAVAKSFFLVICAGRDGSCNQI
jgi:hypothetical protein